MTASSYHMTPDEFRRNGHEVVEWVARYMETVERYPVLSRVSPGSIRAALPASAPVSGEPFDAVLRDVDRVILPGITHWQSPSFFAYFPANASGSAILGELVAAGLGVQGMLWATSPACTELETHVLDWVADMLGLPQSFRSTGAGGGVIQDSASSATLCAMLAARERATGGLTNREGARAPMTVYASSQAHSSVEKAARIAGIGSEHLRLIETDAQLMMKPGALAAAIDDDLAANRIPAMVVATVGTTSTMSVDPLPAIGEICARRDVWLHVDAAMAGTAAVCPEFRWIHEGLERADSYCFNPHKWMFTNFDCDAFYVADRRALVSALSVLPEYLRNPATESGAVIDYRDWQIPLGRRFRSLKLWFVIRHYGVRGIQHHVREHVALASEFASWVAEDDRFQIAAPVTLNLVCFRLRGDDADNERLLGAVNDAGIYLTHTKVNGRTALRMSIGGTLTERRHVEAAWELIRQAAG